MNINSSSLSVIVPVYKAEKYLRRCVDSILAQTYRNFELILIDDGSPDNSGSICDEYMQKDKRVKVFHQENQGVSSSRNLGIEQAQGEWITFIDSDDWVDADFLEKFQIENAEPDTFTIQGFTFNFENHPDKDFLFSYYKGCKFPISSDKEIAQYDILRNGYPFAKLYHKAKLQQYHIRFNTAISIHEDHAFVWEYLCHTENIKLVQSSSYHYEKKEGESLSNRNYPSTTWLAASESLLASLSILQAKCHLEGTHYLKETYTSYGLEQTMKAIYCINRTNYQQVISSARGKYLLFSQFFLTKTPKQRIVLYLLKQKWSNRLLFFFIHLSNILSANLKTGSHNTEKTRPL